jgi:TATA-box binding protein (TBP) (component of TFIID and TFIIIB)
MKYVETITATHDVGHAIKLGKLHTVINKHFDYDDAYCMPGYFNSYEAELFPALQLKVWRMGKHVNVFSTSKCVITGLKHFDEACVILDDVTMYIHIYKRINMNTYL